MTIDPSVLESIDLSGSIQPHPSPVSPTYTALKAKYQGKNVPGHRIGFTEVQKLAKQLPSASVLRQVSALGSKDGTLSAKVDLESILAPQTVLSPNLAAILTDLPSFADEWLKTQGDRTFEELDCVGYNPETRMLSGVITIKRNSGYSGDLCDPGSTEYVGFWAFYDGSWQSLGSTQVTVHDLAAVSAGNTVKYAAYRAVNLPERLCGEIQGIPLRAILSWQTPPTGPDFVPVWGNVVNTHVQPIIIDVPLGDQRARLMRINRVTVTKIDANGFAQASDIAGDCSGKKSPFGGPVHIEGDFTVKSDAFFHPVTGEILPGQHPPAYKVFVKKDAAGAVPTQLVNSFDIAVYPPDGVENTVTQEVQPFGGEHYYLYREGIIQAVNPRMLAVWEASGFADGKYIIEVQGFVWNGAAYIPMTTPVETQRVHLYNGYLHTELDIDGLPFTIKRPELELRIDPPVGDCGDVTVGSTIHGQFRVRDEFFGSLDLRVLEITVGGVPQRINLVSPRAISYSRSLGNGTGTELLTWTLDTTGMTPCGYTVLLGASDRALVGDSCHGHSNQRRRGVLPAQALRSSPPSPASCRGGSPFLEENPTP